MKKSKIKSAVLTVLIIAGSLFTANAQDASPILKKMDDVMYSPKDMTGKNKIVLIDKNGKQETREATIQQKGND
ncbi:MAG: hypothetical protein COS14_06690, partial [Bacteroidetes bacterium CG02_land_8_20_14_3_00_31_25]